MAQTKRRRRRKHRGTQGGRIDRARRGRPRTREEAKARARSRPSRAPRGERPPTWRSAINRALIASGIFFLLLVLLFGKPVGASVAFASFMLVFYVPMGYFIDRMVWNRRLKQRIRTDSGRR